MIGDRSADSLIGLIRELCKQPHETEWLELKKNYARPQGIGEYISALANSAVLAGKSFAYMVWGVRDDDHTVVGTTFTPKAVRVGGEELETWLLRLLEPKIDFRFFRVDMDGHPVVLLEVARSDRQPVRFSGTEYVRVGSSNKKLKDLPEKERALWRSFEKTLFEEGIAVERLSDEDVLGLLDYPAYFDLLQTPLPANRNGILAALADDDLICECDAGGWNITHLGAILFAKRLDLARFGRLRRKTVRVVQYRSFSRTEALSPLAVKFCAEWQEIAKAAQENPYPWFLPQERTLLMQDRLEKGVRLCRACQ